MSVSFGPRAEAQLASLLHFIAGEISAEIAEAYVDAIVDRCESLADFPNRGTPRDDIRAGLRTIPFRRRVAIAYAVRGLDVLILGIFYAGQDLGGLAGDTI